MKYLALALLLCAPSLSKAVCMGMNLKPDATHCLDFVDETWHAVGAEWKNSQCWECTCSSCCRQVRTPTNFPDYCVSVFDLEFCEYIVHKKDDPSVLCPIYGMTLRK